MIRLLDGLVLLKEVDDLKDCQHSSSRLKKAHPDSIVIIRRVAYIYASVLEPELRARLTILDDFIPLGVLASSVSIDKGLLKERLRFMNATGVELFKYLVVGNVGFIGLDSEFKYLFQNYQPFLATLQDYNLVHCKMLGDLKIGFY